MGCRHEGRDGGMNAQTNKQMNYGDAAVDTDPEDSCAAWLVEDGFNISAVFRSLGNKQKPIRAWF